MNAPIQPDTLGLSTPNIIEAIFRASPSGMGVVRNRVMIEVNDRFCKMVGRSRGELIGSSSRILYPTNEEFDFVGREKYAQIRARGWGEVETRWVRADGSILDIHLSSAAIDASDLSRGAVFTAIDITAHKASETRILRDRTRLEMISGLLQQGCVTAQEFLDVALDRAIELTGSRLGYIYMYDEDGRKFILNAWSKDVMKSCAVANPQSCYELDKTGIWGEAVRQRRPIVVNNFQADHPLKRGYPEGHVELTTYMTVPVFEGERIVAVAGVANKPGGYDESDVLQIRLMMDTVWKEVRRIEAESEVRRIEWMLSPSPTRDADTGPDAPAEEGASGDLSNLNACRTILDAVGKETLRAIVRDFLDLLGTSAAVYEINGDYALDLISSGWCRILYRSSRAQCGTNDAREAMASGKWLCHELCWRDASMRAIEIGAPADVECEGGLHIYAVPIRAGGGVVGVVNIGYGDPPRDPAKLLNLAERFGVDVSELEREAKAYESRPPFIVDLARRRLETAARLIGEIVERSRAEKKLSENLVELQRWHDVTLGRETRVMELKREVNDLLMQSGNPPRYNSVADS